MPFLTVLNLLSAFTAEDVMVELIETPTTITLPPRTWMRPPSPKAPEGSQKHSSIQFPDGTQRGLDPHEATAWAFFIPIFTPPTHRLGTMAKFFLTGSLAAANAGSGSVTARSVAASDLTSRAIDETLLTCRGGRSSRTTTTSVGTVAGSVEIRSPTVRKRESITDEHSR